MRVLCIEVFDLEVLVGEIDELGFDVEVYVVKVVVESSLEELLKLYMKVLGEVRVLDVEKKVFVYDNYSKFIIVIEIISKVSYY